MAIEDLLSHPLLWRGQDGGPAGTAAIATGFDALDGYLPGGGWPLTGISEIFIERYGLGELSILMPALAALSHSAVEARKWIVWIAPPFVPYAPALLHHGVDLSRILLVHPTKKRGSEPLFSGERVSGEKVSDTNRRLVSDTGRADTRRRLVSDTRGAADTADTLWALEQAIRSQSSVAALAWVRQADVTALRRLQLGAETYRCWTVLFRPAAAMAESSPAALRFRLLPGDAAGIRIEILKCRGRRPQRFSL